MQKEKRMAEEKEQNFQELQNNIKKYNIHIIQIQKKTRAKKKYLKE